MPKAACRQEFPCRNRAFFGTEPRVRQNPLLQRKNGFRDIRARTRREAAFRPPWRQCKNGLHDIRATRYSFLERETRFELATSTLARLHSTTELLPRNWRRHPDLNPRLQPWQGCTLPLSYSRSTKKGCTLTGLRCQALLNFFSSQICKYA